MIISKIINKINDPFLSKTMSELKFFGEMFLLDTLKRSNNCHNRVSLDSSSSAFLTHFCFHGH